MSDFFCFLSLKILTLLKCPLSLFPLASGSSGVLYGWMDIQDNSKKLIVFPLVKEHWIAVYWEALYYFPIWFQGEVRVQCDQPTGKWKKKKGKRNNKATSKGLGLWARTVPSCRCHCLLTQSPARKFVTSGRNYKIMLKSFSDTVLNMLDFSTLRKGNF